MYLKVYKIKYVNFFYLKFNMLKLEKYYIFIRKSVLYTICSKQISNNPKIRFDSED